LTPRSRGRLWWGWGWLWLRFGLVWVLLPGLLWWSLIWLLLLLRH
jgi:hypothetical protein